MLEFIRSFFRQTEPDDTFYPDKAFLNKIHENAYSEFVGEFRLPERLVFLIKNNHWPLSHHQSNQQLLASKLNKELINRMFESEQEIFFYTPPFGTIQSYLNFHPSIFDKINFINEIDYSKAVIIGDFGMGSDAFLILYYSRSEPTVFYEKYLPRRDVKDPLTCEWKICSEDFESFANSLGLPRAT